MTGHHDYCNTNFGPEDIWCSKCGGEGRLYTTRYGGNDPDVIDAGQCEACNGTGTRKCERQGCDGDAASQYEGKSFCNECLSEIPGYSHYTRSENICPACGRAFKDGQTCSRGGCPMGGDF